MNIQVSINAPELAAAINNLANALGKSEGLHTRQALQSISDQAGQFVQQQQEAQQAPPQQQEQPPTQQQAPTSVPTAPPTQQQAAQQTYQQPAQQNAVPTSSTSYDMQQLAVAATQLMDAGKQQELFGILGQFNVQALTQLPQEQYGAFATKLREAGANI